MSKEKKNDSNEAPPVGETLEKEQLIKDYFSICPECTSSIEILSINENNNIIEFRCLKENKEYTMSIKEFINRIKEKEEKNIEELKDKCKIHNKNNECYCFDCNCHLCNECLKTRIHINHKKSNIIEIKPVEEELNIINKVIEKYKKKSEELKEKHTKRKDEIEEKIKNEKENEEKKSEKEKQKNKRKKEKELKDNNDKYLFEIDELRKEYENKIKKKKKEYEEKNNIINNKYKLMDEKEEIKKKIKIENIKEKYNKEINNSKYEREIEDIDNILKINEMIYNIYDTYKNNYYNAININKLLLYYSENKDINENIMKKELNDKYDNIIKIIKQKNNDDIELKKIKEKEKREKEELNKRIKEIEKENEKIKLENINKIKEKENEINEIKNKINQNIFLIF